MAKEDESEERRTHFVSNLRSLMEERSLTVRETAKKAGITDFKRFYRWASVGISRATHNHDADLERLREFFGLSSLGQFWKKPDESSQLPPSLSDKLRSAGQIELEYDSAYKVLVAFKGMDEDESSKFRQHIDTMFEHITKNQTPEDILEPKTADQIMRFIKINHPFAFEAVARKKGGEEAVLRILDDEFQKRGGPNGLLEDAIVWAIKHIDDTAK